MLFCLSVSKTTISLFSQKCSQNFCNFCSQKFCNFVKKWIFANIKKFRSNGYFLNTILPSYTRRQDVHFKMTETRLPYPPPPSYRRRSSSETHTKRQVTRQACWATGTNEVKWRTVRKTIFFTGLTRAAKARQISLVPP